jgi:hypothetical protein
MQSFPCFFNSEVASAYRKLNACTWVVYAEGSISSSPELPAQHGEIIKRLLQGLLQTGGIEGVLIEIDHFKQEP